VPRPTVDGARAYIIPEAREWWCMAKVRHRSATCSASWRPTERGCPRNDTGGKGRHPHVFAPPAVEVLAFFPYAPGFTGGVAVGAAP